MWCQFWRHSQFPTTSTHDVMPLFTFSFCVTPAFSWIKSLMSLLTRGETRLTCHHACYTQYLGFTCYRRWLRSFGLALEPSLVSFASKVPTPALHGMLPCLLLPLAILNMLPEIAPKFWIGFKAIPGLICLIGYHCSSPTRFY